MKYIAIVHGRNELVKCESCLNMKRSVTTFRERSQDRLVFDVYFRGGKEEMFDEFSSIICASREPHEGEHDCHCLASGEDKS